MRPDYPKVIVESHDATVALNAKPGENLRQVLLRNGMNPNRGRMGKVNCGGLGICGSCKIWLEKEGEFWEQRACQKRCYQTIRVRIPDN